MQATLKKLHDLETEGKTVNKLNRNKDFFHVIKDVIDAFAKSVLKKHQSNFIAIPLIRRL